MSMQTGSIDADGLARTSDGKLYVTLAGSSGSTSPAGAPGFTTVLAQSWAATASTNTTSEEVLATVNIAANQLGANGRLRIFMSWTTTNSANLKTHRVRMSGIGGTVFHTLPSTTSAGWTWVEVSISNRGATNSQVGQGFGISNASALAGSAQAVAAIDTTAATTLVITSQKATGTETNTLDGYTVELIRP